jgi:uncharacterized membrane protein YkvA (DUF1232 family)
MTWLAWLLPAASAVLALYALFVGALLLAGRRHDAQALARFIPDCVVLFRRLLSGKRLPRRRKLLLVASIGYLALPFDLIPDFIPVVGHLDDVIVVALVFRSVLRGSGASLVREHWPGPPASLNAITHLASRKGRPQP